MPKDTSSIPTLPSRILNSKRGPTSSGPATRLNTRGHGSQSSKYANPHRLSSSAQTSHEHLPDHCPPKATKLHKPTSAAQKATAKKVTAKDKRQADLLAAEENAARLDACGYNEDEEEEAEATYTQGGTHRSSRAASPQGASNHVSGDEDEDESPEKSRRPHLTRGLSIEDVDAADDFEDDGIVGLDNQDSDFDDPANSPTHQGRRKDKSRGIKFVPVGSTTTIASKLPPKKRNKKAGNQSSEGARSPARTGTSTTSSSPRSVRGTTSSSSPRTPRNAIVNSGRPRMVDQTPATVGLLKAASSDTRQELAVKDAFPERVIFTENCKAAFLAACNSAQAVVQRQRFLKSDSYRTRMLNILRQKLSQMRQDVRNAALAKTAIHYGITSTMNPADIVERVRHLKTKFAYVFADPDSATRGPYGNAIFQILINSLFFEGKRKSEAISNPAPWNPMPLPVLALTATAIHSVLDDWSAGKNEAAKNQFTHDKYAPIYRDHLANLTRFNEKAPAAVAKLRTSLWENAWASTGCAIPDEGNVYIDDDVFAEAEAEALA